MTASSVPEYLAERGLNPTSLHVQALSGGVSNAVFLVQHGNNRFVLKQALPQLLVEEEWFSDIRRIFTESLALRTLAPRLPPGSVPEVLFEDPQNYLFAMTAAEEGSESWKTRLFEGEADERIAERVAAMLGTLVRESWGCEQMARDFEDMYVFEELRLDPYYGRLAALYPELSPQITKLIESCRTRRVSLVHGDWSPKNILVKGGQAMAIDFEVMHFGDPSFDAAFLLNHLLLKTFYGLAGAPQLARTFWSALIRQLPEASWFERATIEHLGALLLARIDGKSPAEYIPDTALKDRIRTFARDLILDPPDSVADVWKRYAAQY